MECYFAFRQVENTPTIDPFMTSLSSRVIYARGLSPSVSLKISVRHTMRIYVVFSIGSSDTRLSQDAMNEKMPVPLLRSITTDSKVTIVS